MAKSPKSRSQNDLQKPLHSPLQKISASSSCFFIFPHSPLPSSISPSLPSSLFNSPFLILSLSLTLNLNSMAESIHDLPPSKRFKLLQSPSSCLPAKKRAHLLPSPTTCLPAKKRIWAPPPLSPLKHLHIPQSPQKQHHATNLDNDDDDDGIICAVCRSTDADPADPIVFCDGCDLTVHSSCYGNPLRRSIPSGDWFCLQCQKDKKASCCLCPRPGGALKPTTGEGEWAHIVCGLLVPEVFFRDPEGRDGIDCSRLPAGRREVECYLCGCRSGCGIGCSEPRCGLGFHVSCGVEEGLWVEYREGKKGGIVAGFCKDHTKLWMKQQETGKFKIVAREEGLKRKTRG